MIFLIPLFLFASVKSEIINFYKKTYPNIIIEKITANPALPKHYKKIKFLLSPKQNSGSIIIDGKYYYITIKAEIPVFVATSIIRQNSPILPYVVKKIVKFRYFYSKPLEKISPNLIASKIISKNSVINESNTKIAPAVLRGERVSVLIKSKNITISSSAKALRDGNIGDIIPIEMNRKIFNAKVTDKGVVTLEN
ncbi:flagellar basal body P-ring formation chaperone FlgA [Caminibacter pacificus]|uniref:Flagella basal body P-ring formation protein FlgA n=1 Tax=Caminibacter pacificus TaxID=1424653 RepID=A0ABX5TIY0_9BACT|nr:flagellar basal body P-ring formation protein FlgA [Caminibacter pacificus]